MWVNAPSKSSQHWNYRPRNMRTMPINIIARCLSILRLPLLLEFTPPFAWQVVECGEATSAKAVLCSFSQTLLLNFFLHFSMPTEDLPSSAAAWSLFSVLFRRTEHLFFLTPPLAVDGVVCSILSHIFGRILDGIPCICCGGNTLWTGC